MPKSIEGHMCFMFRSSGYVVVFARLQNCGLDTLSCLCVVYGLCFGVLTFNNVPPHYVNNLKRLPGFIAAPFSPREITRLMNPGMFVLQRFVVVPALPVIHPGMETSRLAVQEICVSKLRDICQIIVGHLF